jgi:dUTP pyrophosphatase
MEKVFFGKVNEKAIIPSKDKENGGYDIYATITDDVRIEINETKLIPTGLVSAFSSDFVMVLKERGSTGTKAMSQKAGIIDSGYRGEWFVPINNTSRKVILITNHPEEKAKQYKDYLDEDMMLIYPTSKAICQALLIPVPDVEIVELPATEIKAMVSKRAEGALGSSGK